MKECISSDFDLIIKDKESFLNYILLKCVLVCIFGQKFRSRFFLVKDRMSTIKKKKSKEIRGQGAAMWGRSFKKDLKKIGSTYEYNKKESNTSTKYFLFHVVILQSRNLEAYWYRAFFIIVLDFFQQYLWDPLRLCMNELHCILAVGSGLWCQWLR